MSNWLPIPGYEDSYEVSDEGQVRLLKSGKLLRGFKKDKTSHLWIRLAGPKAKHFGVHHLVLLAFVGPPPKGMESRHYPDRDPANNRLENLSWATRATNVRDRKEHGTDNAGERHGMSKLTWNKVAMIRETGRSRSQQSIAEEFGVTRGLVGLILSGKIWKEEQRK